MYWWRLKNVICKVVFFIWPSLYIYRPGFRSKALILSGCRQFDTGTVSSCVKVRKYEASTILLIGVKINVRYH